MATSVSAVKGDLTSNPPTTTTRLDPHPSPWCVPFEYPFAIHYGGIPKCSAITLLDFPTSDAAVGDMLKVLGLIQLCVGFIGDQAQQPNPEEP
jgi:hypothetical protein